MLALSFSELVLYFVLYATLGWVCETIWCSVGAKKLVNRGFLGGPWCPVYGFGVLLIMLITEPFRQYPALVFAAAMVLTSLLEYFTGWLLETLFKTTWWDYSNRKFQIKGRVCLRNSLMFGLLGLAVTYALHPLAADLLALIAPATQRLLASGLIAVLLVDFLRSLAAASHLSERIDGLRQAAQAMELYQEAYRWYDKDDIPASIGRLRALCAEEPDNKVAAGILLGIETELRDPKGSARLVKAFPRLMPRESRSEFEALKAEWAARRKARRQRAADAKAKLRAKERAEREAAKAAYQGVTLTQIIWVFATACVLGYVVESLYCLVTQGFLESRQGMLYGPFNQVYGFGAVLMVLLLTPLARKSDRWLFFGGAVVGGLFEAACSWIQEAVFGSVSWQYADQSFAFFGGRTSLTFMFFWGILCVLYMKLIYPRFVQTLARIPKRPLRVSTWAIAIFLSVNMLLSAAAVDRWNHRVNGEPAQNAVEVWLDENYPDDKLQEIYPKTQFVAEGGTVDDAEEAAARVAAVRAGCDDRALSGAQADWQGAAGGA